VNNNGVFRNELNNEYSFKILTEKDVVKVKEKRWRKKVPINKIIPILLEGKEIFIPDIDRRKAWYIKKRLEKEIRLPVVQLPAEVDGESGYVFRVSIGTEMANIVKEILEEKRKNYYGEK